MNGICGVNNELRKFIAQLLRSNAQVMVRSETHVICTAHLHVVLSCIYFCLVYLTTFSVTHFVGCRLIRWTGIYECVKGSGCSWIWGIPNYLVCLGGLRNVIRISSRDSWSAGPDLTPKPTDKETALPSIRQGHSISFGIYREVKSIGWTCSSFGRMIACKAQAVLYVN
jgi:hypothetical protein